MSKSEYLKLKNIPIIIVFIIWCVAIYITFQAAPEGFWDKLISTYRDIRVKDGILVVLSPILALVLTGLITPANKARLVFWKWKYPLPGHRAFSKLALHDSRINLNVLERKLTTVPTDPMDQNRVWFAIYKNFKELPTVKEAHRSFLLARDLTSISFIFAFLGFLGLLLFGHRPTWALLYFALMIGHYLVLAITARNFGNRFVSNVLCEYTTNKSPQ